MDATAWEDTNDADAHALPFSPLVPHTFWGLTMKMRMDDSTEILTNELYEIAF